jgi:hypothetical protein
MIAGALIAALTPFSTLHAADDETLVSLATCQESWTDWKQDPARGRAFRQKLESAFRAQDREPFYLPLRPITLLVQPVARIYPDSVGMGVGFSVLASASFEAVKASMERQMGKPFDQCGTADGAKSCERKLSAKRTVILMEAGPPRTPQTLFGCYYFYAQ